MYVEGLQGQGFGYDFVVAYGKEDDGQKQQVEQHEQQDKASSRAEGEAVFCLISIWLRE